MRIKLVAGLLLLFSLAAAQERRLGPPIVVKHPETLIGGPFVVNVGPKTATIAWVTKSRGQELGKDDPRRLRRVTRSEKVVYKGLQPGATYAYEFKAGETVRGRFKTAPAGPVPFRFVVYGDTRSRHDVHRRVMAAAVKAEPDFVIHTGDYVADGGNTSLWPIFFSIEKDLLRGAALYPAIGNHEHNSEQYYMFLQAKPYYSWDWGSAHFVVLDSDVGSVPGDKEQYWAEEKRWLEEDLAKSRHADLRFVAFHHPPYSAVPRRGQNQRTVQLVPLLEKYKVAAVFSGHDHNYQRFLQNNVQYVTTGGGGAPLYPVDNPPPEITRKVESIEHYVRVDVEGKRAVLEAVALDGRIIDRIELASAN